MRETLFMGFGAFTVLMALSVVFAKQAAMSAFSLVLTFLGLAGLYVLWGSNFMAILQVLIYTGAIVVLFVFVVMLLDKTETSSLYTSNTSLVLITLGTVWCLSVLILRALNRAELFVSNAPPVSQDMRVISKLLFTEHLWAFEILSVFLLALIVAVCVVARPVRKGEA